MKNKNLAALQQNKETAALKPFEAIDRAFEDFLTLPSFGGSALPRADIKETDKEILVSVALPGVDKKDIQLDLREDSLSLSCERKEEKEETGKRGYYYKEQSYGKFYRTFALPAAVKPQAAKAEYKNGVLNITMQKQKETKTHKVNID